MALGQHFFYSPRPNEATPSFDTISRDSNFNWIGQGRLSTKQAMQFTGSGEDGITIEGRLYPHLFGGLKTLDNLRLAGQAGKPLMLSRFYVLRDPVQYVGEIIGRYGIRRVRKNEKHINGVGLSNCAEFTLELVEFGEDAAAEFLFANPPSETSV